MSLARRSIACIIMESTIFIMGGVVLFWMKVERSS